MVLGVLSLGLGLQTRRKSTIVERVVFVFKGY